MGCAEESENPTHQREPTHQRGNHRSRYTHYRRNRPRYTHRQRCFGRDSMPPHRIRIGKLIATLERNPLKPSHFYVPDGEVELLPRSPPMSSMVRSQGASIFIFVIKKNFSIKTHTILSATNQPHLFSRKRPVPWGDTSTLKSFSGNSQANPRGYRSTHFGFGKNNRHNLCGFKCRVRSNT